MLQELKNRRHRRMAVAMAAVAGGVLSTTAAWADKTWDTGVANGSWATGANWVGGVVPLSTDNVFILFQNASQQTISLNMSYTSNLELLIRNLGSGTTNFIKSNTGSLQVGSLNLGEDGNAELLHTAGTISTVASLRIADFPAGQARYNLVGGLLAVGGEMYVGNLGQGSFIMTGGTMTAGGQVYVGGNASGTFNQSAGFATFSSNLNVGSNSNSSGRYFLSDTGVLNVIGDERIGYSGFGTFSQSGGTHNLGSATNNSIMFLGLNTGGGSLADSTGRYLLSGGTFNVFGTERIGHNSVGTFNQSGGTHTVGSEAATGSINIGNQATGVGTYLLSGGGMLNVFGYVRVGAAGTGTFNQTGGTHTLGSATSAASLSLGNGATATGTYLLSGTGLLDVFGTEIVGNAGTGIFNQSGGTHNLGTSTSAATLNVGSASGSNGTFLLSGGTFNAFGQQFIGQAGNGTFSHSGGTHNLGSATVSSSLNIGSASGSTGRYLLSGSGALNVFGIENVGRSGSGTFSQSGGTHTVGSAAALGSLNIGTASGSTGTYAMTGGALNVFGTAIVGYLGTGTFNQSAGTHTLGSATDAAELQIGYFSTGNYLLSNSGVLQVFGTEYVGNAGNGTFTQSGGTHTIGDDGTGPGALIIAYNFNSDGTYVLSGGVLNVKRNEFFGGGTGAFARFNQTGGIHNMGSETAPKTMRLGSASQTSSTYLLSGTGVLNAFGTVAISNFNNSGTFSQSGGTHNLGSAATPGSLTLAFDGGNGTYILSGGVLNVFGDVAIGRFGHGTFNQSGGTHNLGSATVNGALEVGRGISGHYLLSGSGVLNVFGIENVGANNGSGNFIQSGGTNNLGSVSAPGELLIGSFSVSAGTYTLSSGSLNVFGTETVGHSGAGTFSQTGGTHILGSVAANGTLNVGSTIGSTGRYLLSGGLFNLVGAAYVGGRSSAAGGAGSLVVSGGTFNSSALKVWNTGMVQYNGGSFSTGTLELVGGGDVILSTGANKTLRSTSLSIDGGNGSQIDLADNRMIIDYSTLGTLLSDVKSYIQNGAITSSALTGTTAIGYADNAVLGLLTFGGQDVDLTSLLIKFTYTGDTNLDGQVDIKDLRALALNYNGSGKIWSSGDFNYDGDTNVADLTLLARNWQGGVGAPLGDALASLGLPQTEIPEPVATALGLAAISWSMTWRRARRRCDSSRR